MYYDVSLELSRWPKFILDLLTACCLIAYLASTLELIAYAAFYLANFIVFLAKGSPKPTCKVTRWPRVAVIIPCYNDYEILSSLPHVLSMEYPDYIVVVADDSDDLDLVLELAKYSVVYEGRFVHLWRGAGERRGLKAGALNDAINLLEKYNVKYVLILDADFEPPPWMLREMVKLAVCNNAEVVQGYQRHVKGSHTLLGFVYYVLQAAAIAQLVGRWHSGFLPFFTGSCALIKYELLRRVRFREGSLSEDLRWTLDAMLELGRPLNMVVTHKIYANGSVPKSLKAFNKQQIRWSSGTFQEFKSLLLEFMCSRLPWQYKLGFILQGLYFTQGLAVYTNLLTAALLTIIYGLPTGLLWPLGFYAWLLGIETVVLSGGLVEGLGRTDMLKAALLTIPLMHYTALVHAYGTLKTLLRQRVEWKVTSKKGKYEVFYRE